jgi:hypothetical protein
MTPLARMPDWPERMQAAIASARHEPFQWGRHDCALFAANVVAALTGTDLAHKFRDQYADRDGAERILDQHGGLYEIASAALGPPRTIKCYTARGDVVLIAEAEWESLGICDGAGSVHAYINGGIIRQPMSRWRHTWRVG